MGQRIKYSEGEVFAIPLTEQFSALVVVARKSPRGIVLGYFFAPFRVDLADGSIASLRSEAALLVAHFGDPAIRDGSWERVGNVPNWCPQDWSSRFFRRQVEPYGVWIRTEYDDLNPEKVIREDMVPPDEVEGLPSAGMLGAGIVPARIRFLIDMSDGHEMTPESSGNHDAP